MNEFERPEKELKERGDRLRSLMRYRSIGQIELAHRVGCAQSTIGKLLKGECQKSKFLTDIAKELKCDPYWLDLGTGTSPMELESNHKTVIKYSNSILLEDLAKKYPTSHLLPILSTEMTDSNPGKSYDPGDMMLFVPNRAPLNNDLVLALLKSKEMVFRRYISSAGHEFLESNNKNYNRIDITDVEKIVGIIVGKFKQEKIEL